MKYHLFKLAQTKKIFVNFLRDLVLVQQTIIRIRVIKLSFIIFITIKSNFHAMDNAAS